MSAFIERITGSQVGGATERSIRLSLSFIRLGPAIILLLLVVAMTLLSPVFLTGANISNVVVQTSVLAAFRAPGRAGGVLERSREASEPI